MSAHPAVSAILIADTLLEHYLAVARRIERAMRSQDGEEFDSQVADANRAYPGIWDHLDQARSLLAAEGRDVARYDAVRAQQGHTTHAGVQDISYSGWDVDVARSIAHLGLTMTQTVTVQMNITGAVYAHHGSEALKAAMPEVDWATETRAASAPPADVRGHGFVWLIGIGVALLGALLYLLTRPMD